MPKLYVVEPHHHVLAHWAEIRNSLEVAPRLITLDHHTDTSRPFRNYIKTLNLTKEPAEALHETLIKNIDFKNQSTITEAIAKLSNDEHIIAAIKSDIISSAFVIAQKAKDTDVETYREHKIVCRDLREQFDLAIESDFLEQNISEFNKLLGSYGEEPLLAKPYIFDIDLDYFNTKKSFDPLDSSFFRHLARNAQAVTIAKEPSYVMTCARESGFTADSILKSILKILNSELS